MRTWLRKPTRATDHRGSAGLPKHFDRGRTNTNPNRSSSAPTVAVACNRRRHSATAGDSSNAGSSRRLNSNRPNPSTSPAARRRLHRFAIHRRRRNLQAAINVCCCQRHRRLDQHEIERLTDRCWTDHFATTGTPRGGTIQEERHVAAQFRSDPSQCRSAKWPSFHNSFKPISVAAASLDPPPRPAAQGIRLVSRIAAPSWQPVSLRSRLAALEHQVLGSNR